LAYLTPQQLLDHIVDICTASASVTAYTLRTLDLDVLSLRVHLVDDTFIEVFFNATTDKTAFALIVGQDRVYGKDNAKLGWHVHPPDNPGAHYPCEPVSFEQFLADVEQLRFSSADDE
jgi:hypothetical protein